MDEQATQVQEGKPRRFTRKATKVAAVTESITFRENFKKKPENICPGRDPTQLLGTGAEAIASSPCSKSNLLIPISYPSTWIQSTQFLTSISSDLN